MAISPLLKEFKPDPHDDSGKSLGVVLGIPCVQRDLLQVQLHSHVDRARGDVEFKLKAKNIKEGKATRPDNVLELRNNF